MTCKWKPSVFCCWSAIGLAAFLFTAPHFTRSVAAQDVSFNTEAPWNGRWYCTDPLQNSERDEQVWYFRDIVQQPNAKTFIVAKFGAYKNHMSATAPSPADEIGDLPYAPPWKGVIDGRQFSAEVLHPTGIGLQEVERGEMDEDGSAIRVRTFNSNSGAQLGRELVLRRIGLPSSLTFTGAKSGAVP